ncbi:GGDEF/EAL domain-containing response regulator [Oleiagrimonas soli]|uniref:Diguanylate cyclase n=1 Tax=Oleiagrimonas soli TaxID=1543381 RepID=A0A099CW82_9GAMM|nr:EAL domain-containing protein [Oleiagrimonas soli]KGI77984.1 diguanylate cyclase [Oleiagrimonas soli]MBB6183636.1 diguanylate cyclase (GGDEF)-like protein/PAS domain S-box-containing protein [Oleiagrimonas soli]
MKQNNVIRILFIEDSVENAEQTISLLRNHGIAVRPAQATNEAELEHALQELVPDLVMVNPNVRDLQITEIARYLEATGKDFALTGIVDEISNEVVSKLFAAKVRSVALRSEPEQALMVIRREFDALSTRRSVRQLEASLRESERRCDALLDSSRDAIAYVHEGMHVRANRAYLEMFGYESFDDIEGLTLLDMVASENADDFKALLKRLSRGEKPPKRVELKAINGSGESFDASAEFAQATFEGEPCLQIIFRRKAVSPELIEQLQRDSVTGMYNRSRMLEMIEDAVSDAAKGSGHQALLLIEPDNWKSIIEGIGLANTDALMAALAERIETKLSDNEHAGRLGDHTLGILLTEHTDSQVQTLVDALLSVGDEGIIEAGQHSITLHLSVGGTLLGEKNANTRELLEQAGNALHSAQTQGGHRSEIYDPAASEKEEAAREQHWLELVEQALEDDGFILYQQQIISLQDAEGEFSEILLRMNGPNGEVLPRYFLPVAERAGLMPKIDRWVLGQVIEMLTESAREKRIATYFVKLTPQSLQDATLMPWLSKRIADAGLRPGSLVVEMPESKVLTTLKPAQDFVNALKETGAKFALEQFGSGLNSFQVLQHVDADYLKIDRSYMNKLTQNPENRDKIADICLKAQKAGKLTVAEWVEDAASTPLLFACGVDFVQGNFLQEPEKIIAYDLA